MYNIDTYKIILNKIKKKNYTFYMLIIVITFEISLCSECSPLWVFPIRYLFS